VTGARREKIWSRFCIHLKQKPFCVIQLVKTARRAAALSTKVLCTYVLKSSISSIASMEPRKDWSGLYSRVCIPGSFYPVQPTAGVPDPGSYNRC